MENRMNPLVSVVIPTYNSAKYIESTLDSALNQDYRPIEIIVVDDGSTDRTQDVLRPLMSKIMYFYKVNGGPGSARNLGIKNAKGEYIAFLDADDIWLTQKIERQMDLFKKDNSIGLVHTHCLGFREDVDEILSKRRTTYNGEHCANVFPRLFWRNFIANSSVMVKTECFQKVGLFDEENDLLCEDYDMWLRISQNYKIGYVGEALTGYRIHSRGISRKVDSFYLGQRKVLEKTIEYCPDIEKITGVSINSRFSKLYLEYGLDLLSVRELKKAREQFLISLSYRIFNIESLLNYFKCLLPLKLYTVIGRNKMQHY